MWNFNAAVLGNIPYGFATYCFDFGTIQGKGYDFMVDSIGHVKAPPESTSSHIKQD
jgi:hypothetical protein